MDFYRYFRWLSLDIVLGAILFLAYLIKYYQLHVGLSTYFALGSAIWLIYTADHLIDARNTPNPSTERHRFHKKYFHLFVFVGGMVLSMALFNLYFLDIRIIRSGAILSAVSVAYLTLVFFVRRLWIKEVLVALVYACGIYLAPLTLIGWSGDSLYPLFQLSGVALLNLMIFSRYDLEKDLKDGFHSLTIRLGKAKSKRLIWLLATGLLISVMIADYAHLQAIYGTMTLLLIVIDLWPAYFMSNERFRTLGDGIFYLPGLLLLL